jgi:SAM-dependent methyltransferase
MIDEELSTPERISRLFQHLGIRRAHVAGAMHEVGTLVEAVPELVASLTLLCPFQQLVPAPLRALGSRLLFIHGDSGPSARITPILLRALPDTRDVVLHDYSGTAWCDPAADRGADVTAAMLAFLEDSAEANMAAPIDPNDAEGEIAGITYRVTGSGEPLVLFPLSLAASQWDPIVPILSTRHRVVTVGGAYIGAVGFLAERARGGYGTVVQAFVHEVAPTAGERVLEVGCGSGEVTRVLARYAGGAEPVVGVDVNRYLLREAASLARAQDLAERVRFEEGDAESLLFPDASFDVTVSCTVMEEVNADRMLAEMLRVTRPGGRIGVMVRAVDVRWWIGLPLPPDMKAVLEMVQGAGLSEGGCADVSLYRRFIAGGLTNLRMGPKYGTYHVGPGFMERRKGFEFDRRTKLGADDAKLWDAAVAQADAEGTFMWASPYHCAVGTKRS